MTKMPTSPPPGSVKPPPPPPPPPKKGTSVTVRIAQVALFLLIALPAAAEVGIVPGSSSAIPSERFAWCGRVPTGPATGYVPKPMIADLAASGGDWPAAKIKAAEPYGFAGYMPVAGVVGAEARGVLKGHVDELCRLGLLGPWQAPGSWDCRAVPRETEILGGLPGGCSGVNPVRRLWMETLGPSVRERALEVSYPYEPCGLHQAPSVLFRDVEWRRNTHDLCGQPRPAEPLRPPYGAAPVPQEIIEDPSAERLTKLPAIWPPAACWYDSRSGFGSGVRLWLDSPGCRGEVVEPPEPPGPTCGDGTCEPGEVCPADCDVTQPPRPECDLAPVMLELEAIRAEIQALRSALAGLAATADSLRARQQEIDRRAEVRCKALATSAAQRAACEVR